jgi:uncharacterized membrane protein
VSGSSFFKTGVFCLLSFLFLTFFAFFYGFTKSTAAETEKSAAEYNTFSGLFSEMYFCTFVLYIALASFGSFS